MISNGQLELESCHSLIVGNISTSTQASAVIGGFESFISILSLVFVIFLTSFHVTELISRFHELYWDLWPMHLYCYHLMYSITQWDIQIVRSIIQHFIFYNVMSIEELIVQVKKLLASTNSLHSWIHCKYGLINLINPLSIILHIILDDKKSNHHTVLLLK